MPVVAAGSPRLLLRRMREIMAEMTPLEEALGRLRAQIQQVVSEQKKRERSQHLKAIIFAIGGTATTCSRTTSRTPSGNASLAA